MVCISAKNLLRSAYQERRLYRMSHQLFEFIIGLPLAAQMIFAGARNLEDAGSMVRIGMVVPWDEISVT